MVAEALWCVEQCGLACGQAGPLTFTRYLFLIFSDFSDYKIMDIMLSPLGPLKKVDI